MDSASLVSEENAHQVLLRKIHSLDTRLIKDEVICVSLLAMSRVKDDSGKFELARSARGNGEMVYKRYQEEKWMS